MVDAPTAHNLHGGGPQLHLGVDYARVIQQGYISEHQLARKGRHSEPGIHDAMSSEMFDLAIMGQSNAIRSSWSSSVWVRTKENRSTNQMITSRRVYIYIYICNASAQLQNKSCVHLLKIFTQAVESWYRRSHQVCRRSSIAVSKFGWNDSAYILHFVRHLERWLAVIVPHFYCPLKML